MDDIDRMLLDRLRHNGRASYGELGDAVRLSPSAVKRRIDRLVADGVIRGFTVDVDPAIDGLGTEAYVELFCRGKVAPGELRRLLGDIPGVVEVCTVSGDADALMLVRTRDVKSLEAALERVRLPSHVERTRSSIVLSRLIDRTRG
jgi:DNA-binding Lrp family transcriptional regulator